MNIKRFFSIFFFICIILMIVFGIFIKYSISKINADPFTSKMINNKYYIEKYDNDSWIEIDNNYLIFLKVIIFITVVFMIISGIGMLYYGFFYVIPFGRKYTYFKK